MTFVRCARGLIGKRGCVMGSDPRGRQPQQLGELRAEIQANPALADVILARPDVFPPASLESERVIRCSRENAERAVCRALAEAAISRELWRVEIVESQR